ncbi:MAG: GAF domain-containing protein [Anaerolineales bacterium]
MSRPSLSASRALLRSFQWDWLSQIATAIYLFIALFAFLFIPIWATEWLETPFIGALVEQTMVFNGANSVERPSQWDARNQGLVFGYQLTKVGDQRIANAADLEKVLRNYEVGDQVTLWVKSSGGREESYSVRLIAFPQQDRFAYLIIPYIIGLIFLISGLWVFAVRRNHPSGLAYVLFSTSIGLCTAASFDLGTTHHLTLLWVLSLPLAGASIIHLTLTFPQKDPALLRRPWLSSISYIIASGLVIFAWTRLYDFSNPTSYLLAWQLEYVFTGASLLFSLAWFIFRRLGFASPVEREQIRNILTASVIAFGPVAVWFLGSPIWVYEYPFSPYLLLPLIIFPLTAAYTLQRYRLLSVDFFMSRAVLYVLLVILVTVGYALMLTGLTLLLGELIPTIGKPVVIGLTIFILALLLLPVRQRLERLVSSAFFRGEQAYQDRLQTFSSELTGLVDLKDIVRVLREYVQHSLLPVNLHVFIFDPMSEQYIAMPNEKGERTSDLRFALASPLARILGERRSPIRVSELMGLDLQSDRTRVNLLHSEVLVPLPGRQRLAGWIAIGQRLSGDPYSFLELGFLKSLSDQAALAIERAQVVMNVESRMRQMNVLTRVAQGINITLNQDDILELVYTQTTQIIPADDFSIMLMSSQFGAPVYIFYVEDSERVQQNEYKPVVQKTLEQEVIRQRRVIVTEDYLSECQRYGIGHSRRRLFAWVGVPLNAGAETIGALSLAKRDTSMTYTSEQIELLNAIANQLAGAIVKNRLLQEAEQRARQLTILNEVTRQLTSTLDITALLQTILKSAVDILNCVAGSLFLLDEQTDELVFVETVGPVADNLVGKRLPPGVGVVGQAVKTRQPIIENDVRQSSLWSSQTDEQTGFDTRSLLAVPLQVKDRVIGVIEVVNRSDGLPFAQDDLQLLNAFAAQAAVAIENARLYTMTDQALAARVEELSVMQRIDRELNASLESGRAMKVALNWAMRHSGASAGLIGSLREDRLQIMEAQGYNNGELEPYLEALLPLADFELMDVLQSGVPKHILLSQDGEKRLLTSAQSRLVVPIRREASTIGMIVLESEKPNAFSEEMTAFLMRLSDHAAIAISNAQLYAAVQAANVAKSEFVSFVSHELKNPMTSIKGYTELLAAGAVGPVTEAQANFLSTIRSNVERMSTLVSDLADVSRIEAGRLKLDFKPIALKEVVEEVARSLRRQIEEKKQHLVINVPDNLPSLWADRTRLAQIITNLLSNAHKYTSAEGQIWLNAEVCENQWDESGAPRVVHIWVQDTGIGIAPEDQVKIFQKFFRSEDPKTREVPGTGLGLNITKSLVEFQGGKIWFESEFRKGSIFHFTIPIAE